MLVRYSWNKSRSEGSLRKEGLLLAEVCVLALVLGSLSSVTAEGARCAAATETEQEAGQLEQ